MRERKNTQSVAQKSGAPRRLAQPQKLHARRSFTQPRRRDGRVSERAGARASALALALASVLSGCGGLGSADGTESADSDGQRYFQATYRYDYPDEFTWGVSNVCFAGDKMYYQSYAESDTQYAIYYYDLVSGDERKVETLDMGDTLNAVYLPVYAVTDDGDVYYLRYNSDVDTESASALYADAGRDEAVGCLAELYGYSTDMAEEAWDSYYEASYTLADGTVDYAQFLLEYDAPRTCISTVVHINKNGAVLDEYDVSGEKDGRYTNFTGLAVDGNGCIYVLLEDYEGICDNQSATCVLRAVNPADGAVGTLETASGDSLATLPDGTVALVGASGGEMTALSVSGGEIAEGSAAALPAWDIVTADGGALLVGDAEGVSVYHMDDGGSEQYVKWDDCNIAGSDVRAFGRLSDGTLAVYLDSSVSTTGELATVAEVSESEWVDTKTLVLACFEADSTLQQEVAAYNKSQQEYHITIQSYRDDADYDASMERFTVALSTDEDIDLVLYDSYKQMQDYSVKGLNADLYEFLDADETLSREDFLENILAACEYDGKLVCLPRDFTLVTLIGKTSDVGDTPGWTIAEAEELLASKPEGTQLFEEKREWILQTLVELSYDEFFDWENGTCDFENEDFIGLLEFSALFPEEWQSYEDDSEQLHNGTVLLMESGLSELTTLQLYREVFGGELTFVGYPTVSGGGTGALLDFEGLLGVTVNCDDIAGAWGFVKSLHLYEGNGRDENVYGYSDNFSIRRDGIEAYCQNALDGWYVRGGAGGGAGDFYVQYEAVPQSDVDAFLEVLYNTTAVNDRLWDDALNIILEEADTYYSGQKTAEEAAEIIQNRMGIYMSETKG